MPTCSTTQPVFFHALVLDQVLICLCWTWHWCECVITLRAILLTDLGLQMSCRALSGCFWDILLLLEYGRHSSEILHPSLGNIRLRLWLSLRIILTWRHSGCRQCAGHCLAQHWQDCHIQSWNWYSKSTEWDWVCSRIRLWSSSETYNWFISHRVQDKSERFWFSSDEKGLQMGCV